MNEAWMQAQKWQKTSTLNFSLDHTPKYKDKTDGFQCYIKTGVSAGQRGTVLHSWSQAYCLQYSKFYFKIFFSLSIFFFPCFCSVCCLEHFESLNASERPLNKNLSFNTTVSMSAETQRRMLSLSLHRDVRKPVQSSVGSGRRSSVQKLFHRNTWTCHSYKTCICTCWSPVNAMYRIRAWKGNRIFQDKSDLKVWCMEETQHKRFLFYSWLHKKGEIMIQLSETPGVCKRFCASRGCSPEESPQDSHKSSWS